MPQQRLPLKKVRIQKHEATKSPDRYQINRQRLSFLPTFFTLLVGLSLLAGGLWYYDPFHFFNKAPVVAGVQEVVKELPPPTPMPVPLPANDSTLTPGQSFDERNIRIQNANNQDCFLTFSPTVPSGVTPITNLAPTGWWLPGKCADPSLLAIQILRTDQPTADGLKQNLGNENFQKLDDIDTYAIAYTDGKQSTIYDFQPYVKTLTLPIFQDRYYFNEATAASTMRRSDVTYYLEGKCRGGGTDPCKLWRRNNTTGQVDLLKKNIADTGIGQKNELKSGIYLDFAAVQDYDYGLNFILVQESTSRYQLIRIRLSDFTIVQTLNFEIQDSGYKEYFR